ncbi:LysE family translocator [Neopusillimonas maritima]|jgi:threonine/homoserine/homoserine lactone efflux protein|uniref:Threonine transporter RhtB n=1 Tax=Neopusillimonas maritima TaxID=2026239 RepID=A0ABX9MX54_9BURK|nr:LysE family translocator [Neopusillimonas maritima]RII83517.1 threonine transporter RhtB [Neopusillimonas maritima]|tara:strand:- start:1751 stop:2377 length:627 start_codon:yes stop_codon:yes gene_type:complete
MLTVDVALSFFGIAVLLALSPGPDNLFVLMQSAMWGKNAGMAVVLGLCTGLIGHTVAVAVGLAAVFAASETAFLVLKLAGAAYLLYLAWGAFRAPVSTAPETRPPALSHWALYRRGIIMNLTNPKVSLFFLAFLPQFTSPMRGSVALQTISLGALFMLAAFLVFSAIALFSGFFSAHLQKSAFTQRLINRLSALVFAGLALRLLLSER